MKYILFILCFVSFARCANPNTARDQLKKECVEYGNIIFLLANDTNISQDMVTYMMYDRLFGKCQNVDAE